MRAISSAEARASIRREAPRQAIEDQSRFLQIGMGQNPGSSVGDELGMTGRQSEAGGLSSYIPTTTTTATRAADLITVAE